MTRSSKSANEAATTSVAAASDGHVDMVTLCRPPHNYFDIDFLEELVAVFARLDADPRCRAVVLAAQGRSFCAGAEFGGEPGKIDAAITARFYETAVALFSFSKPVVAAIQGPAVGGGLGLSLVADFRIASPAARFSANFARLGIHSGFGISAMLPRIVGQQAALLMLETGRRVDAEQACKIGLVDQLVEAENLMPAALDMAREIAAAAPIAVQSMRNTLLGDRAELVRASVAHELAEQEKHFMTDDFREGVRASHERRAPIFKGR